MIHMPSNEIWFTLFPILIADIVNPVLFAFMVYAAGTSRPIANSCAVLLGHTLAYFSAGFILALGLNKITERLVNPQHIDFFISLVIGIFLLWFAFRLCMKPEQRNPERSGDLAPFKAFTLGAIVNFIGIPFALPYFAVIDQILKADLGASESLFILIVYNLLYALPFITVPLLTAIMGDQSRPILLRINDLLERVSSYLVPVLLSLVGFALVTDGLVYFVTGEGLIPVAG